MQLDKKHVADYVGTMEATIEIQSLQIVGFLSMVCQHLLPTNLVKIVNLLAKLLNYY